MKRHWIVTTALLATLITVSTYAQVRTDSSKTGTRDTRTDTPDSRTGHGMSDMSSAERTMMEHRQKMVNDMEAANAEIERLVDRMTSAEGAEKTAAMEELLVRLAARHQAMSERMMTMEPAAMAHMRAHMAAGTIDGMKQSMADCPMMSDAVSDGTDRTSRKRGSGD